MRMLNSVLRPFRHIFIVGMETRNKNRVRKYDTMATGYTNGRILACAIFIQKRVSRSNETRVRDRYHPSIKLHQHRSERGLCRARDKRVETYVTRYECSSLNFKTAHKCARKEYGTTMPTNSIGKACDHRRRDILIRLKSFRSAMVTLIVAYGTTSNEPKSNGRRLPVESKN